MLKRLAGQTAVYGISTIGARLLNYLLTPYLTRMMAPELYGVIGEFYALIPFMLVLLTMGMETGYFKFSAAAQSEEEKRNVFRTAWGAVTAVSLAFFAVILLFNKGLAAVMHYGDHPSYVWITGAIIAVEAIFAIPYARLRRENRAKKYVALRLFSVVITIVFTLFFLSVVPRTGVFAQWFDPRYSPGYCLIANLISSVIVLIVLCLDCRGWSPRIDRKLLRRIFLYSLPLLVGGIAGTANEYIDRQFIKYLMPEDVARESVGIYSAVVKIGMVMMFFVQMYRLAAEPFFLSDIKKDDFKTTNAAAMKYFIIAAVFIFLVIGLFPEIFALIIGKDYREGIYILPVVLLGNLFSGVVFNLSFWYKQSGQTKYAVVVTGSGLVFTVALNIALIPVLGYFGAALARLGCEIAMTAISYGLNRKHYDTPYDLRRIFLYLGAGLALYAAGVAARALPYPVEIAVCAVSVCAFALLAVKRESIRIKLR